MIDYSVSGLGVQLAAHNQDGAFSVMISLPPLTSGAFIVNLSDRVKGLLFTRLFKAKGWYGTEGLLTPEEFTAKLGSDTWK